MPFLHPTITLLLLGTPFAAAALAPVLVRTMSRNAAMVLALVPLVIFLHFCAMVPGVAEGHPYLGGFMWVPAYGVQISFFLDGLSLTFALLISGIGTLIILYSGAYLGTHAQFGRFLSFMFLFMGSMLGLVCADNMITMFVLWEMTSVSSYLLIGFGHERERSRRAAMQALVVTGTGGLALLAGYIVIQNITGLTELSLVINSGDMLRESPFYVLALLLVLGGAFTKSAQYPFHFWLPNAMEAPTPVSAYLHSATMVKAGVYLLMRLNPVLGDTVAWETILPIFGGTTLLVGAILAVGQTDLKLMLAQTTVASLGLLVMLVGWGGEKAMLAATTYLLAHAFFKGGLFMAAGAIDLSAGTRNVTELSGLRRSLPFLFGISLVCALSMAGIPPFIGFVAKEEIYYALAKLDLAYVLATLTAVIGNGLMLAIAFAVAVLPFIGQADPKRRIRRPGFALVLGTTILAIFSLSTFGFAGPLNHYFISPMASAIYGHHIEGHLAVSFALGPPLYLSILTIALGCLVTWKLVRARQLVVRVLQTIGWGPDQGFDQFIAILVRGSYRITRFVQSGRLEAYLTVTAAAIATALVGPAIAFGELPMWPAFPQLRYYEWAVFTLAIAGLIAVLIAQTRLTAIVSLGIQGFAVALIFVMYGAPDLAFTQFMVETLSVVILALVMTRLHLFKSDRRPVRDRIFDIAIATVCGIGIISLLLITISLPFDQNLSEFFAANSLSVAHGRNIVNVIIVDFRALDTLGEISVVVIAGLAIMTLMRMYKMNPSNKQDGQQ